MAVLNTTSPICPRQRRWIHRETRCRRRAPIRRVSSLDLHSFLHIADDRRGGQYACLRCAKREARPPSRRSRSADGSSRPLQRRRALYASGAGVSHASVRPPQAGGGVEAEHVVHAVKPWHPRGNPARGAHGASGEAARLPARCVISTRSVAPANITVCSPAMSPGANGLETDRSGVARTGCDRLAAAHGGLRAGRGRAPSRRFRPNAAPCPRAHRACGDGALR